MTFSLLLTYSSICFMLLLMAIYFNKQIFNNTRTKLFKLLIILTSLFTISEMIPIYAVEHFGNATLEKVTWRIHWIIGIAWFTSFFYYCISMIKKI